MKIEKLAKCKIAFSLRRQGKTYKEIGVEIGVNHTTASQYVAIEERVLRHKELCKDCHDVPWHHGLSNAAIFYLSEKLCINSKEGCKSLVNSNIELRYGRVAFDGWRLDRDGASWVGVKHNLTPKIFNEIREWLGFEKIDFKNFKNKNN